MRILLIGAPNVGKTTLFNYLTKKHQKVSNISGTTVSFTSGYFNLSGKEVELVDTPGLYTLYNDKNQSITDKMVTNLLLEQKYDLVINVVTEENLHNNLLLTSNLLDLGMPTIVIVNVSNNNKQNIDTIKLETLLGCKVLKLNLNKLTGLDKTNNFICALKNISKKSLPCALANKISLKQCSNNIDPVNNINLLLKEIPLNTNYIPAPKIFYGLQVETKLQNVNSAKERFDIIFKAKDSLNLSQKVTQFASRVTKAAIRVEHSNKKTLTDILDMFFLNKFLGLPIFLLVMYFFFFIVINVSKIFQDFFQAIAGILFVSIPTAIFSLYGIDNFFSALIISLGSALQVIATFIPILFIFHICLDFLENTGYMSRGAYLTDSIMRFFGLPGKSLVTMLVGFGCNVPAVLATRTVSNKVERILTIVAAPFISCSARLTVYVLFTAIFFPKYGTNIVYILYLAGIVVGVFTVWFFKSTLFKNKESFFILELPKYRLPKASSVIMGSARKVYAFVFRRAGKIIIPVMMIFYILHYAVSHSETIKDSFALKGLYESQVVLAPMGITKDNWEATVSLIGGTVAKEIVVTTLQSLYLLEDKDNSNPNEEVYTKQNFISDIKSSLVAIKDESKDLLNKLSFGIDSESEYYSNKLATIMESKFKGIYGAIAYLLFTVIYTPCLITLGAVRKELNSKWMHFTNIWSILLAYIFASATFQILTFKSHMLFSTLWLVGCVLFFVVTYNILSRIKLKV